ncbi:MAG TPA: hypothetical protein VK013_18890 [Myxococcaceae bacterium]|nr:hypothetical protein [Myxococcaceae bacterium]
MQVLVFLLTALSPIGGMTAAVPLAILGFGFHGWSAAAVGVLAAWSQALVVDLGWRLLERRAWWQRWLERRRSGWAARKLSVGHRLFWPVLLLTPLIGSWVVMALVRLIGVPQRRIALPMVLGLSLLGVVLVLLCEHAPQLMMRLVDRQVPADR